MEINRRACWLYANEKNFSGRNAFTIDRSGLIGLGIRCLDNLMLIFK